MNPHPSGRTREGHRGAQLLQGGAPSPGARAAGGPECRHHGPEGNPGARGREGRDPPPRVPAPRSDRSWAPSPATPLGSPWAGTTAGPTRGSGRSSRSEPGWVSDSRASSRATWTGRSGSRQRWWRTDPAVPRVGSRSALNLDFLVLEYVPPRVFATTLALAAEMQLGFNVEFPLNPTYRDTGEPRYPAGLDGSRSDEAIADGESDQLGVRVKPEGFHHLVLVELDGPRRDREARGDLLRRLALR